MTELAPVNGLNTAPADGRSNLNQFEVETVPQTDFVEPYEEKRVLHKYIEEAEQKNPTVNEETKSWLGHPAATLGLTGVLGIGIMAMGYSTVGVLAIVAGVGYAFLNRK